MKRLDHCFEWYSFPNILNLSLTNENVPTLRASREVRTPLEGEYIEGEAAPPSKRKTFNVFNVLNVPDLRHWKTHPKLVYSHFCVVAASKKDLPGWRIGLNWLCGVEMDDGDGVAVEAPQVETLPKQLNSRKKKILSRS